MDHGLAAKLERLKRDFKIQTGRAFEHFFCPILFRDEDVPLCRAHVINVAFGESSRRWTVQRQDVDNFWGSVAEADFVHLKDVQPDLAARALVDPELRRAFKPRIRFRGREIQHFAARGNVPRSFTPILFGGEDGTTTRLVLKVPPHEIAASSDGDWELDASLDITPSAILSIVKAAHLTLFELFGYKYALSRAGAHIGRTLGAFFVRSRRRSGRRDLKRPASYLAPLVRPVISNPHGLRGTIDDGWVQLCWLEDVDPPRPWAMIVFVRTANHLHAALLPTLDDRLGVERFVGFCRRAEDLLSTSLVQYRDDCWYGSPNRVSIWWPAA